MNRLAAAAGIPIALGLLDSRRGGTVVAHCDGAGKPIKTPSFGTASSRSGLPAKKYSAPVTLDSMVILSGSAHPELAKKVAAEIKVPLCNAQLSRFADGEVSVQIFDNLRGKDVFIIQSCAAPVNDSIMELLLTVSCIRRADVHRLIAVVPYFGYKHHRRGTALSTKHHSRFLSSGAADFAAMLEELGVDRVIAVDLQRPGQGHEACFFDNKIPVESLLTTDLFVDHLIKNKVLSDAITVVAPNAEGFKKARNFQNGLRRHYKSVNVLSYFASDSSSGRSDARELTTLTDNVSPSSLSPQQVEEKERWTICRKWDYESHFTTLSIHADFYFIFLFTNIVQPFQFLHELV